MLFPSYNQCCRGGEDRHRHRHTFGGTLGTKQHSWNVHYVEIGKRKRLKRRKRKARYFSSTKLSLITTCLRNYEYNILLWALSTKLYVFSGSHYLSNGLLVFFNPGDLLASMIFFNCLRQLGSDSLNSRHPAPHRPPLQRSHMRGRYREPAGTGQEIQSLT